MSETVSVDNPFGEPGDMTEYDYMFDPYRRAAAAILRHMELYPDDVVEQYERKNGTLNKALAFTCTAPYNERLGMYLNPLASTEEQREKRLRMSTDISAGVAIPREGAPSYWARIQRHDGDLFGLAGVSKRGRGDRIERWRALTATIELRNGQPVVGLWGERPEDRPGLESRQLMTRTNEQDRKAAKLQHCQTIYTVFDRTILSRQSQNP